MIQLLELFGGIGSPRIALRNIGVEVKAIDYVEICEKAVKSYNAMFAEELAYNPQTIVGYNLKPDILVHGSPCQDFSIAGHQKGADEESGTRSSLMWETIRIIEQMGAWKPRIVIWENVKNVLSKHMIKSFNKYLNEMQKLGYTNSFEILNAMDFGLPQKRERVFTVSFLDGTTFEFDKMKRRPTPHIKHFLEDFSDKEIPNQYLVTQPSMLKVIEGKSKSAFNGRVPIIEDSAWTITTKQMRSPNSGVIDLGNGKYRYLTERECWRLQGYSDQDFDNAAMVHPRRGDFLNGTLYHQAGNSIPVTILESMFMEMI